MKIETPEILINEYNIKFMEIVPEGFIDKLAKFISNTY